MKITRIYTDEEGESCFGEVEIPMEDKGDIGSLSAPWKAKSVIFRENSGGYNYSLHTAPARQFVVMLQGGVEIETSRGDKRIIPQGEVLLAEDVTGKGHISRAVNGQPRVSIFIVLE